MDRREFLVAFGKMLRILGGSGLILSGIQWDQLFPGRRPAEAWAANPLEDLLRTAPRAGFWTSPVLASADCGACHNGGQKIAGSRYVHQKGLVKCLLCAQGCVIQAGQRGRCRARMNVNGELRSLVYGRAVSVHVDPIEKKPLYHFLPGSAAFSLATAGCPLQCQFCQNWEISQAWPEDFNVPYLSPADIAKAASARKAPVIAFTYNEPTVFTEYLMDIARVARKADIRSALISCGFMNEKPLAEMCRVLSAIKVDLKGYDETFYRKVCGAELKPILRSIRQIAGSGIHLEIVTLVVPTLNDSDRMLRGLADWVHGEIGPDVPIHFTRFHPDFKLLNLPPIPVATLERAREIAMDKGIHYAYVGNVPDHSGNHTYCPSCKKVVIRRQGFFITEMNLKKGRCGFCQHKIAGVWS